MKQSESNGRGKSTPPGQAGIDSGPRNERIQYGKGQKKKRTPAFTPMPTRIGVSRHSGHKPGQSEKTNQRDRKGRAVQLRVRAIRRHYRHPESCEGRVYGNTQNFSTNSRISGAQLHQLSIPLSTEGKKRIRRQIPIMENKRWMGGGLARKGIHSS